MAEILFKIKEKHNQTIDKSGPIHAEEMQESLKRMDNKTRHVVRSFLETDMFFQTFQKREGVIDEFKGYNEHKRPQKQLNVNQVSIASKYLAGLYWLSDITDVVSACDVAIELLGEDEK